MYSLSEHVLSIKSAASLSWVAVAGVGVELTRLISLDWVAKEHCRHNLDFLQLLQGLKREVVAWQDNVAKACEVCEPVHVAQLRNWSVSVREKVCERGVWKETQQSALPNTHTRTHRCVSKPWQRD